MRRLALMTAYFSTRKNNHFKRTVGENPAVIFFAYTPNPSRDIHTTGYPQPVDNVHNFVNN